MPSIIINDFDRNPKLTNRARAEEQSEALSDTAAVSSTSSSDELSALQLRLMVDIETAANATGRMQKSVEEYWRRTGLLFGVLAR